MSFKMGEAFVEVTAEDKTEADTSAIGGRLAKWATGLGIGALIGKSISDGMNIETGVANIQNQLGLTAADASQYGDLAGSVYRDNFGESLDEVNGVIGTVGQAMGGLGKVSNDEITGMTEQVMQLSSTFDLEATESVAALSTAVSQGLAPSLQNATDIATRVFQEGGPKAREFLDVVNEYAPNLAAAGISMEQFGSMSVAYLDAGGFSVDQFADSIREMTIRVSDGSAESAGAFDTLGLNAADMTAKLAQGGPAAQEAFNAITSGLAGMTDPVAQNTAGAQLFGSMWEDSSGAILAGLAPLPDQLGQVAGATQNMADVAGDTAQSKIETMKRNLEGLLTGAADLPGPLGAVGAAIGAVGVESVVSAGGTAAMVASFAMENAETIKSVAGWTAKTVSMVAGTVATGAATAAQWLFNAALSANPIALVVIAIVALVAGLVWFFTQTEMGKAIIEAVWSAIQTAIGATVGWITGTAVPAIVGAWQWVVDKALWVRDMAVAAWNAVMSGIGNVVGWITGTAIPAIVGAFQWVVDKVVWVKDMYVAIWSAIFSVIGSTVSGILSIVTSVIGAVVGFLSGAWNGALGVVRSVWSLITSSVSGAVGGVLGIVRNIPGQILGVFGDVGSLLTGIGKKIIDGLINGIKSAIGGVKNVLGSVTKLIPDWKGPADVDAELLKNNGQLIIGGLVDGFESKFGVVKSTLAGLTDDIANTPLPVGTFEAGDLPGMAAGATGLVATSSAGSSVTIGNLTLQIEGKFDFSNPVEWDRFIEAVRAGLVKVEREYA